MSMFILSTQEDGINRVCFKSCINSHIHSGCVRVMVFNNISAISWQSVLLVEETGGSGENHRPAASHRQTLLHNGVSSTTRHERDSNSLHNFSGDRHCLYN